MSITVRRATREDAAHFLELMDALAAYEQLEGPDEAARQRLIADAFDRDPPRYEVHLAFGPESATPMGYTITFETYSTFLAKPTLYLEDFFVRPEHRTRGAGSALFDHLAALALERGCGRMEWACLNWNELAQRFYEKRAARHLDDWRIYRFTEDDLRERVSGA